MNAEDGRVVPMGLLRFLKYFKELESKGGLGSAAGDRIWLC